MDNIKYLPSIYYKPNEVENIQASLLAEDIEVKEAIEYILEQIFVDTATWGLDSWERMLELKIDRKETYENRRARIKMRLRGVGTFNKVMIKNLCKSFVNGNVCVIENNSDYSFTIKFIDIKGIPGNLEYLKQAIEEVKPAHLNFSFKYLYNTWGFLSSNIWGELENKTWEEVRII